MNALIENLRSSKLYPSLMPLFKQCELGKGSANCHALPMGEQR